MARRRSRPSSRPASSRAKSGASSSSGGGRNGRLDQPILDGRDHALRQFVLGDVDRPGLPALLPAQPVDELAEARGMVLLVPGEEFGDLVAIGLGQLFEFDLAFAAQMRARSEAGETAELFDPDALVVESARHEGYSPTATHALSMAWATAGCAARNCVATVRVRSAKCFMVSCRARPQPVN